MKKIAAIVLILCSIICMSSCGSKNETTVIVDSDDYKQVHFTKISLGYWHSAALTENGDLYMWGNNKSNECLVEDEEYVEKPTLVMNHVKNMILGGGCTFIIKEDDSLWSCGDNNDGQLGVGKEEEIINQLTKVMDSVSDVVTIYGKVAAITNNGELYFWGNNSGEIADRDTFGYDIYSPVKLMDNVVEAGFCESDKSIGVVTNDGKLLVWGSKNVSQKEKLEIMSEVKDIAFGDKIYFVLTKYNDLYKLNYVFGNVEKQKVAEDVEACYAGSDYGYLTTKGEFYTLKGLSVDSSDESIQKKMVLSNVMAFSMGRPYDRMGALDQNGYLYMWGDNRYYELGNGRYSKEDTVDEPERIRVYLEEDKR